MLSIPVFIHILFKKTTPRSSTPPLPYLEKTSATISNVITEKKINPRVVKKQQKLPQIMPNTESLNTVFSKKSQLYFSKLTHITDSKNSNNMLYNIIQDKKNVTYAAKLISHFHYTKTQYGNNQGKIRLFAIHLLAIAAQFGHRPLLETLIKKLLSSQSTNKDIPGKSADIIDLITAWIEAYGKEKLIQDPLTLFEQFDYDSTMRPLFATAIRYAFSPSELNQITPRLLDYLNG